jgi:hypothetical protein
VCLEEFVLRKVKQVLCGGLYEWEGREGGVNMVEYYVLMFENGKMRPVETIPGMEGGG